jgi:hypothetical protein
MLSAPKFTTSLYIRMPIIFPWWAELQIMWVWNRNTEHRMILWDSQCLKTWNWDFILIFATIITTKLVNSTFAIAWMSSTSPFWKMKGGLWDHLPVCVCVCAYFPLAVARQLLGC